MGGSPFDRKAGTSHLTADTAGKGGEPLVMRYLPAAYYWLGRAQEKLGGASAGADSYRKYVELRKEAEGDPLVADARKRAASR